MVKKIDNKEQKKFMSSTFIKTIYILLVLVILAPIIFFIYHFYGQSISQESSHWSEIGGYVGGIIGTIIALANLIVFVKLTQIAGDLQDAENEKQRKFRKNLLIAEIQNDLIKNLSETLYSLLPEIEKAAEGEGEVTREELDGYLLKVKYLIERFKNMSDDMFDNIETQAIEKSIDKALQTKNIKVFVRTVLADYEMNAAKILKQLRKQMINHLDV